MNPGFNAWHDVHASLGQNGYYRICAVREHRTPLRWRRGGKNFVVMPAGPHAARAVWKRFEYSSETSRPHWPIH